jgi:hypothetical protein
MGADMVLRKTFGHRRVWRNSAMRTVVLCTHHEILLS